MKSSVASAAPGILNADLVPVQVANDTTRAGKLSQEADDIEEMMSEEFANKSAQVGCDLRPQLALAPPVKLTPLATAGLGPSPQSHTSACAFFQTELDWACFSALIVLCWK